MDSQAEGSLTLRVGSAKYIIQFHEYRSGETAIEIVSDRRRRAAVQCVATVSLMAYAAPHPSEYGVWLKGWNENEGVPEAVAAAGIVTLTGRKFRMTYCDAEHAELTESARLFLAKAKEAHTWRHALSNRS